MIIIKRVKQYNSTYKSVVIKDNIPLCITSSEKRAGLIASLLQGDGDIEDIKDIKIRKIIEQNKEI